MSAAAAPCLSRGSAGALRAAGGGLTLVARQARNLARGDVFSSSPFLVLRWASREMRTSVLHKELHPVWPDTFRFICDATMRDMKRQYLTVECRGRNTVLADSVLGSLSLNLHVLANAPVHVDHVLRDAAGAEVGRVSFDCHSACARRGRGGGE